MIVRVVCAAFAALGLAFLAAAPAAAQSSASEAQIAALTETYFGGVYGYDEAAIRAVTSPAYVLVEGTQRLDRDAALGELLQAHVVRNGYADATYRTEMLRVSEGDGGAVVADVRTIAFGSALNGGPSPLFEEVTTTHRMTWQQGGGSWLLVQDQIVEVSR